MTLPGTYFDDLYAGSPDPWGFTDRWYERRKRALTLALLPEPRYAAAYEPGCSIGVLTRELAGRCDELLATDVSAAAVAAAGERCADLAHVTCEQATLPADWPARAFDLVVLSELGYYFDRTDLAAVAAYACGNDTVLAVHWRHPVKDYPLGGDEVHLAIAKEAAAQGLFALARYRDEDVVAEVWRRDPQSVGTDGGLS
jgi:hypothetical protein